MFKSKTVWFNVAVIALGVVDSLAGVLPPGKALIIAGAVGIVLRAYTSQSLAEK